MPRKNIDVTIPYEGRDKGKVFNITEMPSARAERWAMHAMSALIRSGVEVPEGTELAGMRAIVAIGLKSISSIPLHDLEPLMAEMFECIRIRPDPAHREIVRALMDGVGDGDDIEEIQTRIFLRQKTLELHVGFSIAGAG